MVAVVVVVVVVVVLVEEEEVVCGVTCACNRARRRWVAFIWTKCCSRGVNCFVRSVVLTKEHPE